MIEVLEWTCKNCKYDDEDMEGTHCRHCIHNATENFEPKEVELSEQEIRNKAIDEFVNAIEKLLLNNHWDCLDMEDVRKVAEQIKESGENE